MKPAGIKVVPYVNTLTWQNLGSNNHWMNATKNGDVDIRDAPHWNGWRRNPDATSMLYGALTP